MWPIEAAGNRAIGPAGTRQRVRRIRDPAAEVAGIRIPGNRTGERIVPGRVDAAGEIAYRKASRQRGAEIRIPRGNILAVADAAVRGKIVRTGAARKEREAPEQIQRDMIGSFSSHVAREGQMEQAATEAIPRAGTAAGRRAETQSEIEEAQRIVPCAARAAGESRDEESEIEEVASESF